jgi:hypothetical protein
MIVAPACPDGQRSWLGPAPNSVRLATLPPMNSPISPATPGVALHLSNRYVPETGTLHTYQTKAPPRLSWMVGSPGSSVTPALVPVTISDAPLISCAPARLSLAGGWPDGTCGVILVVGCDGWLGPPAALVAVTVKLYFVPSVRPVTRIGQDEPVAVMPPGLHVTA